MFLLATVLLIGLASAQKVTHLTYCAIGENQLRMDCKFEPSAESPKATCKYTQGDSTLGSTDPDEPKDADYKNSVKVSIVDGINCQLRYENLPEGKYNFTCNVKQTESASKTVAVEKRALSPCSAAWSVSLQRWTGTWLAVSALPILLLQISGML